MPLPRRHDRRRPLAAVIAIATAFLLVPASPAHAAPDRARVDRWSSTTELRSGTLDGAAVSNGAVVLRSPKRTLTYTDPYGSKKRTTWQYGSWTSPWVTNSYAARNLVPSWTASTAGGTWLRVSARVKSGSTTGSWDTVGVWAFGTSAVMRSSSTSQTDDLTALAVDTLKANGSRTFDRWQLKVDLLRKPGSTASPQLRSVSGVSSSYAARSIATSRTTMTKAVTLAVPSYSQMTHRGHYTQWGGGGEAWCSPTSVAMVLRYFGGRPTSKDWSWAKGGDGQVDQAARYSYDYRYRGTGNWPFSVAYAGAYGFDGFVTRLYDLREAEAFIKKGLPVVISVAFRKGELSGAPISSTPGHLMIISGFTKDGKVVVNDPAGSRNSAVRRTYSRAQLERAWLKGSGGVAYVVRPESKALPADTPRW